MLNKLQRLAIPGTTALQLLFHVNLGNFRLQYNKKENQFLGHTWGLIMWLLCVSCTLKMHAVIHEKHIYSHKDPLPGLFYSLKRKKRLWLKAIITEKVYVLLLQHYNRVSHEKNTTNTLYTSFTIRYQRGKTSRSPDVGRQMICYRFPVSAVKRDLNYPCQQAIRLDTSTKKTPPETKTQTRSTWDQKQKMIH